MKGALKALLVASVAWLVVDDVQAIVIPINCGGMLVGNVDVNAATVGGRVGVRGGFTSNAPMFPNLGAAATKCNEHHFNWYQIVSADNMPPVDAGGNRLAAPYVDPPPGGYGNDPTTAGDDTQWADRLPWYWDEGADPPAMTPGFSDGFNIADRTTATTLDYQDFPGGPDGTMLTFMTWLVSLNRDGSFHSFHDGFAWMYNDPLGAVGPSIMGLAAKGAGVRPTRAEYDDLITGFDTRIPEPGSLSLIGIGLFALASRKQLRSIMAAFRAV